MRRGRKLWFALLGVWLVLLTGGLAPWLGTPGVLQQLRLSGLLSSHQAEQAKLQSEIERLREESIALERSKAVQHREIRRVLGYAADDEIVFEFGSTEQL
jgi:cell division protein FtsB